MKTSSNTRRRTRLLLIRDDGFTTLEVIMIIVVVVAISVVAVTRFGSQSDRVPRAVAEMMISDIAYAQEAAIARGMGVQITVCATCNNCEDRQKERGRRGRRGRARGHEEGHGRGNDEERGGNDNGQGRGRGGHDDDDDRQGRGRGGHDDDDDRQGQGYGHNDDHRGRGRRGHGRGHGYGYGHHHRCDNQCTCDWAEGGYSITYSDGTPVEFPASAASFDIADDVEISIPTGTLRFDSSGRLLLPSYNWADSQTSYPAIVIDGRVTINIARETGKAWITGS
ncbi:MAG: hypothetical protein FJY67_06310 [Calditrichaeota bacterium]|nr:hypothetical protein [Calditrichota bacterium]